MNVDIKYVGFLPAVSDNGPAKGAPVATPTRYRAVERFSVSLLTLNAGLALELSMEPDPPAQP
jgi:hypothetical protein